MHGDVAGRGLIYSYAQSAHGRQRRQAILAGEKAAHLAGSFGDAGQHQCAVRDRLIAGYRNDAGDPRRRLQIEILRHRTARG